MITSRRFEEAIAKIYFEGKIPVFSMAGVPIPFAHTMEQFCLPNPDKIVAAWEQMKAA